MGAYLSNPVTEKESAEEEDDVFKVGVSAMQGWRTEMEDAHAAVLDIEPGTRCGFFAVFDGHGGKEVAKFCALYMHKELVQRPGYAEGDLAQALSQVYLHMDELMMLEEQRAQLKDLALEEGDGRHHMVVDEADLPDVLREALEVSRIRQAGLHAPQAGNGPVGGMLEAAPLPGAGVMAPDDHRGARAHRMVELTDDLAPEDEGPEAMALAEEDFLHTTEQVSGGEPPPARQDGEDVSTSGDAGEDSGDIDGARGGSKRKRDIGEKAPLTKTAVAEDSPEVTGPERPNGSDTGLEGAAANGEVASFPLEQDPSSSDTDEGTATAAAVLQHAVHQHGDEEINLDDFPDAPPPRQHPWTGPTAGCTAVAAVVRGNQLVVANAGDSRCVFCRKGEAVAMTHDHKPTDDEEHERIMKAGGFVAEGRVNGSLNLSRALGDMEYKQSRDLSPAEQMVTAVPEVRSATLTEGDEFLILACDGIWDVLTNQEAVDFVRMRLLQGMSPKAVCEAVCDRCLAPDTESSSGKGCDNMSVMVVLLKPFAPEIASIQAAAAQGGKVRTAEKRPAANGKPKRSQSLLRALRR